MQCRGQTDLKHELCADIDGFSLLGTSLETGR
jgi:hypothetical protein